MTRTHEQLQAAARFTGYFNSAGLALHVRSDTEGWPVIPGTYGQFEWLGAELRGSERLYVFSDRRNVVPRLRAIPGLHPSQTGDTEARFWLIATDAATLRVVAKLIRAHRRRPGASLETLRKAPSPPLDALTEATVRPRNVEVLA